MHLFIFFPILPISLPPQHTIAMWSSFVLSMLSLKSSRELGKKKHGFELSY
jgi:hypothetical protein